MKPDHPTITNKILEEISDSEMLNRQTQEEVEKRQQQKTKRALEHLENQMDSMNEVLVKVKAKLTENADSTVDFLNAINSGKKDVSVPTIQNLENCMHELQVALSLKKAQ